MKIKKKKNDDLMSVVKREQRKNYIILYTVTLVVWLAFVIFSFMKGYFSGEDFIVNIVNNIIGIIPPILIFDFFNERLSRDSSALEMSNKITETLMSNPETLELFTTEQRETFVTSTIASVAKDEDVVGMVNNCIHNYLFANADFRIRTKFDYNFELNEAIPSAFSSCFSDVNDYIYVKELLTYTVKYVTENANNTSSNRIKLGFVFTNAHLDGALRENGSSSFFDGCIFRESLDLQEHDLEKFKAAMSDKARFQSLFMVNLQIDRCEGILEEVIVSDAGIVCVFAVNHDPQAMEHMIRLIFHMPKKWNSVLEVALVDPVRAPEILLRYPEEHMQVDMFSFLNKGRDSSLLDSHAKENGLYYISVTDEWVYPISGVAFTINKKPGNHI